MRKLLLLALVLGPLSALAQSIVTIPPSQCLWRAGDNPAWAAPTLDESAWQPYANWKPDPGSPHLWIRCHADRIPLQKMPDTAIQISSHSAYQFYFNGTLAGGEGNLNNGNASLNAIQAYPAPAATPISEHNLIALRITRRELSTNGGPMRSLITSPLQIRIGDPTLLDAIRSREVLTRSKSYLRTALYYGIIGVLAIPLLALYFFDRTRTPLLLLGLICLALADLRINEFTAAAMVNHSESTAFFLAVVANLLLTFTESPLVYVLARRRIPVWVWILLVSTAVTYMPTVLDEFAGAYIPAWFFSWNTYFIRPVVVVQHVLTALQPLLAFRPYSSIPKRIRPIAALCMFWGAIDMIWFIAEGTAIPIPGIPNLLNHWGVPILNAVAIATACLLFGLLILLFREQREITRDRAFLAGELHSAGEIQRMLAPSSVDCATGLKIDVAFHPMREVGGDFYSCRILPDNRQRILLGDVSGKGAAAAMTATLLIGAAELRDHDSPRQVLRHMNLVLRRHNVGGFATCLCADIAADGTVTIANAGHLPPYRRGQEISIPSGLPLGLNDGGENDYAESTINLCPGDTLTLLSDGVVEARNQADELFGFERAAAISARSAQEVAQAAQSHGQEDDITVLTLTFAPVGVAHA